MTPVAGAVLEREGGLSILEFVIAMSLLVVILLPAAKLMSTAIAVSGNTRARIVATYLASQTIEGVRGNADNSSNFWNPPPLGSSTATSVVNTVIYSITKTVEWVGQGQSGSNCSSGGSSPTSPLAYVWVEPDGTHLINTATGAVAATSSTVTVTVPLLP